MDTYFLVWWKLCHRVQDLKQTTCSCIGECKDWSETFARVIWSSAYYTRETDFGRGKWGVLCRAKEELGMWRHFGIRKDRQCCQVHCKVDERRDDQNNLPRRIRPLRLLDKAFELHVAMADRPLRLHKILAINQKPVTKLYLPAEIQQHLSCPTVTHPPLRHESGRRAQRKQQVKHGQRFSGGEVFGQARCADGAVTGVWYQDGVSVED